MSRAAIAAVLALEDASIGERLCAFALASFANREQRAWPGTRLAAARAGLSKSQYLAARDGLSARGLIEVELAGGGRGRSAVIALRFSMEGPWVEEPINAELVEAVLSHSRSRGSARLLLASLAAIADERRVISGLPGELIRATAGMAETTLRRARDQLLASGELALEEVGGGRGRTSRWRLPDPRALHPEPLAAARGRTGASRNARPLVATARPVVASGAELADRAGAGGATRGASEMGPGLSGVAAPNLAQLRTVSADDAPQTPPKTPPENPPPLARAGREPWNPRTQEHPPDPPDGGNGDDTIRVEETYRSERGRRRQRSVVIDLADVRRRLRPVSAGDRGDWAAIRTSLARLAGNSMFEIWLAPLKLIAVDPGGALVLTAPPAISGWVATRFGRLLNEAGESAGRRLRFATEPERAALDPTESPAGVARGLEINHKEASG